MLTCLKGLDDVNCSGEHLSTNCEVEGNRSTTAPLHVVLAYSNDAVVERYQKDFHISTDEAVQLFDDVKRFLWLAASEGVVAPPPKVDEGWHTFIIFTLDYQNFCGEFFGRFLHHRPQRPTDRPDGGMVVRKTIELLGAQFGGIGRLSKNWRFPGMKTDAGNLDARCSSDSVSCSPTPSCDSSISGRVKHV
jgi:hypothetical protein